MTNKAMHKLSIATLTASGVVISLAALDAPAKAAVFNLGTLSGDGIPVIVNGNVDESENPLDFINFSISGNIQNFDLSYLNIQSPVSNPNVLPGIDTAIALYDSTGTLIVVNDCGGPGCDDMLSFGNADPLADTTGSNDDIVDSGANGTLLAGDYTLAVSGWFTNFTTNIDDISPSEPFGDYSVQITYSQPVPEPTGVLSLLVMGAFGWLSSLKRKLKGK
ncbi:MAG: PEP-CTERM sorting domain-containing protein [Crocosphaera sp.]